MLVLSGGRSFERSVFLYIACTTDVAPSDEGAYTYLIFHMDNVQKKVMEQSLWKIRI